MSNSIPARIHVREMRDVAIVSADKVVETDAMMILDLYINERQYKKLARTRLT